MTNTKTAEFCVYAQNALIARIFAVFYSCHHSYGFIISTRINYLWPRGKFADTNLWNPNAMSADLRVYKAPISIMAPTRVHEST